MELNIEPAVEKGRFWQDVNILAKEAFPSEEYIAPSDLVKMAQDEAFDFWILSEQDSFVGFMVVVTHGQLAYLFFLAIDKAKRANGYGSRVIRTLQTCYPNRNHVVDFEMVDDMAPNHEQQKRRKDFYLRSGYRETGIFVSYQGVDFEVVAMDEKLDYECFRDMMQNQWIRAGIFTDSEEEVG